MPQHDHPNDITQTHQIPAEQWVQFFDGLSRDYNGWMTTIEVLHSEAGPQNLAADLPLQGFSFDTKGTRPSSLVISAGDLPGQHISHIIELPLEINEASEAGGNIDIKIEPARGPVTLIHLHGPLH